MSYTIGRRRAVVYTPGDELTRTTAPGVRWFRKQDDAIADAMARGGLPVWAEDIPAQRGPKRFGSASYDAFYAYYTRLPAAGRHCYEMIPDGCPCHAYFDLEASRATNPDLDDDRLCATLRSAIIDTLTDSLGAAPSDIVFVELDSSDDTKFSKHWIVKLLGRAWANNMAVGGLARALDLRLVGMDGVPDEHTPCYVAPPPRAAGPDGETRVCVADLAVYTRNRHFRLLGSTKAGSGRRLVMDRELGGMWDKAQWVASLVCAGAPAAPVLLRLPGAPEQSTTLPTAHRKSGTSRARPGGGGGGKMSCRARDRRAAPVDVPDYMAAHVRAVVTGLQAQAKIKATAVSFSADGPGLFVSTYSSVCEIRQRVTGLPDPHGSNHVWYYVDLRRGRYRQGCYNRNICGGKTGQWHELADTHARHEAVRAAAAHAKMLSETAGTVVVADVLITL